MSPNLKDHREIGRDLELFFTDDIAPGAPFWLPKGMIVFKELEKFIRELTLGALYQETSTPIMVKSDIFKQSGHWTKFGQHNMYNLAIYDDEEIKAQTKSLNDGELSSDLEEHITPGGEKQYFPKPNYTLKPMNCPE